MPALLTFLLAAVSMWSPPAQAEESTGLALAGFSLLGVATGGASSERSPFTSVGLQSEIWLSEVVAIGNRTVRHTPPSELESWSVWLMGTALAPHAGPVGPVFTYGLGLDIAPLEGSACPLSHWPCKNGGKGPLARTNMVELGGRVHLGPTELRLAPGLQWGRQYRVSLSVSMGAQPQTRPQP